MGPLTRQARITLNIWQSTVSQISRGWPQRGMTLIGVTGTDGKTTTAHFLAAIAKAWGREVGLISTVGAAIGDDFLPLPPHVSTPGPREIFALLSQMADRGVTMVIVEATSHGLDQRRVSGLEFAVGVITNISPEHLDYHGSIERYAAAKARLASISRHMVLNQDDSRVRGMARSGQPVTTFGHGQRSDVRVVAVQTRGQQTTVEAAIHESTVTVEIPLVGPFVAENAVAAMAAAVALRIPLPVIRRGLADVKPVPGRWIVVWRNPTIIIDFAHTPQALEPVLRHARSLTSGRLIHVFGCAGGRDTGKRPIMGRLSAELADLSIVTAEDPRSEPLDKIFADITASLAHGHVVRCDDRAEAIRQVVAMARPQDVILLTGKGHERTNNIGGAEQPWDEIAAVKEALAATTTSH